MCLMLDQFLWGHSSRVCDISCSFLFLDDGGERIQLLPIAGQTPLRAIIGMPVKCHLMAFCRWTDDGPTLNAGLVAL